MRILDWGLKMYVLAIKVIAVAFITSIVINKIC